MGELIDFAERQKAEGRKKHLPFRPFLENFVSMRSGYSPASSNPALIQLLISLKNYRKVNQVLHNFNDFHFVVEYIAGDIGYKSIYNAALLLILLTFINILASVYLNKLLRTKNEETLNTSDSSW